MHDLCGRVFVDELAAATMTDPIQFRLQYIGDDARAKAVLTTAADRAHWDTRPSPKNGAAAQDVATGRGVGLGYETALTWRRLLKSR